MPNVLHYTHTYAYELNELKIPSVASPLESGLDLQKATQDNSPPCEPRTHKVRIPWLRCPSTSTYSSKVRQTLLFSRKGHFGLYTPHVNPLEPPRRRLGTIKRRTTLYHTTSPKVHKIDTCDAL